MPTHVARRFDCRPRAAFLHPARVLSTLSLAVLALGGTACGDGTGPGHSLDIAVTVSQLHAPVIGTTTDSLPTISCVVDLHAVASGTGTASWVGATVRWYAGTDRSSPIDSGVVAAAEVQAAWGKPGISAGETQQSTWTLTAGAPFTASMEYRYRPAGGDARTATVVLTCGPDASAGAPPPSITDLTVESGPGNLEPSDTLTISYTATSSSGLWQTAVALSGPCDVWKPFPERLQASVTRSVRLRIPADCRLGVPLTVAVFARDAGLQTGSRALPTQRSLVDETPPRIEPLLFSRAGLVHAAQFTGELFGGDSIEVQYLASDNHALSALLWDFLPDGAGVGESLLVSGAGAGPFLYIHLRPEASGSFQLRLHARDAVGLSSDTATTAVGAITVHPVVERPTKSATLAGQTWDALVDTRRGLAYLLQTNQSRIAVLSLSTMTVTQSIPLPSIPAEFDITAGGDSLVVVLPVDHALGIVDLRQAPLQSVLLPLTLLDSTVDQRPAHVRTLSNGKAFVSLAGSVASAYTLIEVDLATGAQRLRGDAGESGNVGGGFLGRSLDHSVIVVNGGPGFFQRYDVATDHFGARQSASVYDVTPVLDATGRYTAVGLDVYDESLQHLRRVHSPVLPPGVVSTALAPDGTVLYQILWNTGLVRSSVVDDAILDRTPNPIQASWIRISDDGTLLVTIEGSYDGDRKISTIDLR